MSAQGPKMIEHGETLFERGFLPPWDRIYMGVQSVHVPAVEWNRSVTIIWVDPAASSIFLSYPSLRQIAKKVRSGTQRS